MENKDATYDLYIEKYIGGNGRLLEFRDVFIENFVPNGKCVFTTKDGILIVHYNDIARMIPKGDYIE